MSHFLGNLGEELVATYLKQQGFSIVARNFRIKQGELDIVALKGELLACVEVKTRSTVYFATSSVITPSKQKKIVTAAKHFRVSEGYLDTVVRFDVALVDYQSGEITYIDNAFYGS
jgi:putative endonuclease